MILTLLCCWLALPGTTVAWPPAPVASPAPFVPDHWTRWTSNDGLPSDKVSAVLVDGDVIWAGTDRGLARRQYGEWSVLGREQGLAQRMVTALALSPATGDLWIGTLGGLSRYSGGQIDSFGQLDSGLINDVVYDVEVVDGRVWVATAAGVSVYDPRSRSWQLFDHRNTVMHEPWCYGLTRSPDAVWVAVWGGGVVEHPLGGDTWRAYRDPDGEMELDLLRDDGLIHDVTSAVSFADGVLWVGTYFGLSRYDGRAWRSWLEHDSPLPSNFINTVAADGRRCWIGTDHGLALTDGESWQQFDIGAGDYVLGLWLEPQAVWVATASGLVLGTAGPPPEPTPPGESQ